MYFPHPLRSRDLTVDWRWGREMKPQGAKAYYGRRLLLFGSHRDLLVAPRLDNVPDIHPMPVVRLFLVRLGSFPSRPRCQAMETPEGCWRRVQIQNHRSN